MPEGLRLVALVCSATIAAPVAVLATPLWVWLWLQQRRAQRDEGLGVLLPVMAETAGRYAETFMRRRWVGEAGDDGVFRRGVGQVLDRLLVQAPHRAAPVWWLRTVLLVVEFAPLLTIRSRFSRLAIPCRQSFLARYCMGLFGGTRLAHSILEALRHAQLRDRLHRIELSDQMPRPPRRASRSRRGIG